MKHVWILSEGEKYEGEHVLAVYATYDAARQALDEASDMAGSFEISEDFSCAKFEDGVFYTIIREQELYS
jgi:hypothetical protein